MRCSPATQPQVLEPSDLVLRKRLVEEVGQRWPAPERLAEEAGSFTIGPALERFGSSAEQRLETLEIEFIPLDLERGAEARVTRRPERSRSVSARRGFETCVLERGRHARSRSHSIPPGRRDCRGGSWREPAGCSVAGRARMPGPPRLYRRFTRRRLDANR